MIGELASAVRFAAGSALTPRFDVLSAGAEAVELTLALVVHA